MTPSTALGRPWRSYAKTLFIGCELPEQITAEGWDNWSNPQNEKTVFYAEYKNTGAGSSPVGRVSWSHQLSDKEAREFTPDNIFNAGSTSTDTLWYKNVKPTAFDWPVKK